MKPTARPTCPIARVALILSDVWTMLILRDLARKPMRFCELQDSLQTVSTRTLTIKLKHLEALGEIKKKGAYYVMTVMGMKLSPIMDEMATYGRKYL